MSSASRIIERRTINMPMLVKVIGWLLLIEGGFMLIPAVVSLAYSEPDWIAFGASSLLTLGVGYSFNRFIRPERTSMGKREGFLLTALVWVVFSAFGMLPFLVCSSRLDVTDAFFEAMAGFTTTGFTIFPDPDDLSHGVNLWRGMMQWIGGLGIILFTLAVLPMLDHSGGMQMFNAEVTGITHDKIRPRISQTAKSLWMVYVALTVACTAMLWMGPMSLFDSICHAMGTVSTGGFTTKADGPAYWGSTYVYLVITAFMFLGGANFSLIFFCSIGRFFKARENVTMRAYVGIIVSMLLVFIIFIALRSGVNGWEDISVYPLFQIVGVMTSTGYCAPTMHLWGAWASALFVPLAFFGACAGSTSGGAKIDRLIVLAKYLRNTIKKALQPNNVTTVKIDGKVLAPETVDKTIAFLSLYCAVIGTGGILISCLGSPMVDAFYSAFSAVTNLGMTADAMGIGSGISDITSCGRWVLAALMLTGRLEVFTVLILFNPNFWHR